MKDRQKNERGADRMIVGLTGALALFFLGTVCASAGGTAGAAGLPLWQRSALESSAIGFGDSDWQVRATPPLLSRDAGGSGGAAERSNARAFLPALMSAVVPGAGQLYNGSLLRGLGYLALEVTGWTARTSFRNGVDDKRNELSSFADRYWDYDRYHRVAPSPDSCETYSCPSDFWSADRDSTIRAEEAQDGDRFREHLTRDSYACGWAGPQSRQLYRALWDDREDLDSAKSFTTRMIFLNHLVSAVDAFIEARRFKVKLGASTDLGLQFDASPNRLSSHLVVTKRFD